MRVSENLGYLFGGPHTWDYSILGSILGFPYLRKLPNCFLRASVKILGFRLQGLRVLMGFRVSRAQGLRFEQGY